MPSTDDPALPASADLLSATPYRTLRTIAAGGMGIILEVEHAELQKVFVAKILVDHLAHDASIVDRMRLEAQALGVLRHENVVEVTDFRTTRDGRPFIVMERLVGRTLGAEVRARGSIPVLEAIEIVSAALDGLHEAHRIGVVHRDFKLDNIFLHEDAAAGRRVVKVLDFGLAKVVPGVSNQSPRPLAVPTAEGALIGTPRYLSPEQARGDAVDARSDVYAAGLVLHALLTGRPPWQGIDDPHLLVAAQQGDEPPPPSTMTDAPIPAELERAVLKALSKDPLMRFPTAAAFAAELRSIADLMRTPAVGWLETVHLGALLDGARSTGTTSLGPRPAAGSTAQAAVPVEPAIGRDAITPTMHSVGDGTSREGGDDPSSPETVGSAIRAPDASLGRARAADRWVFVAVVMLAAGLIAGIFWLVGRFVAN